MPEIKAPSPWMLLLEGRAPWEFAASVAAWPILRKAPAGDGHPVLVIPGLAANDLSTTPLRLFLRQMGYRPYPWNFGLNLGPRTGVLKGCIEHVREIAARHGEPVSLIGWSLGGIYAREVAKEVPDAVRCVITLGTPFDGPARATNAWRLFEWVSGTRHDDDTLRARIRELPPVPTTSILSRSDGIVAWQCSVNPAHERAETIEIHASHIGMGGNPMALYAIADRLAQRPGAWRAFECDGLRKFFYRRP
jgi:pimeloyl-ACP methyl ester carboxylesterase